MRIFLSVLIIVLCIMIAIRLIALYLNSSGNYGKSEKIIQIVGVIIAVIVGVLALLYMLGIIDIGRIIGGFVGILILISLLVISIWFSFAVALFLVAPFLLIAFGKKRNKKAPIIIAVSIWGPLYLFILIFWIIYPREYPYIDLWIYGKGSSEIIEEYGVPEYEENDTLYYRCNWWDGKGYNYYCIELNDEGEAKKIYQDFYDRTWSLGKTMEEIEEKFGTGCEWGDVYSYRASGSYDYDLYYDENGIVIDFDTSDSP